MSKRFFYVAAALFLVTAPYTVTSKQVRAQPPELLFVEHVGTNSGGGMDCDLAIDTIGRIFRRTSGTWQNVGQLPPGTPRSIAGIPDSPANAQHTTFLIGTSNGNVYALWDYRTGYPHPLDCRNEWNLCFEPRGNIFDGTMPTQGTTWGKVKQGYQE